MIDEKILLSEISELKKNMKSENGDYLSGYFSALSTIEGFIAGQDKNGVWILCNNRLPSETGSYLVVTYSSGISAYISDIDHFVHNGMPDGYWINGEDVVAWQPMPEIPEQYKPQ